MSTRGIVSVALVVDGHLHHRGDVAHEAVVRGDAQPAALRQRPAPARLARDGLDDAPQAAGVDRIALRRLAVVPGVAQILRADPARGPITSSRKSFGSRPAAARQLGHERLDRERVRDVRDRAEPADARVRDRLGVLDADVGDRERHVDDAHAELERRLVLRRRARRSRRWSAPRCGAARRPACPARRGRPRGARPRPCGSSELCRSSSRVHVTLTGLPSIALERTAASTREVGLGLASEAAAEQRDVHGDVVRGHAEPLRDAVARGLRRLEAAPAPRTCRSTMRTVAAGGSIVAWARCGM